MKYKHYIFVLLTLLWTSVAWAQHRLPDVAATHLQTTFSGTRPVVWQLPVHQTQEPTQWYERKTSLSKNNIRTFVGYHNDQFIGTLSFSPGLITGEISWQGKTYRVNTKDGQVSFTPEDEQRPCGTCVGHTHDTDTEVTNTKRVTTPSTKSANAVPELVIHDRPTLWADGVLRTYRLAVLVDYSEFQNSFAGSAEQVRSFWASLEATLNEYYMRDIGIKFEIIDHDSLIRQEAAMQIYDSGRSADGIAYANTITLNKLIGAPNYEIGVAVAASSTNVNGKAGLHFAYSQTSKGGAYARPVITSIAHEIGHLFGSDHTFSEGGILTMNTEPGRGTSLMSYGNTARDFFSLASIYNIRHGILNSNDYYTDRLRTKAVGSGNSDNNLPYGVQTNNRPPAIDRSKLKERYTIPQNTSFQFDIIATDPDNDPLYYAAHQTDIDRTEGGGKALLRTIKPTRDNKISFHPTYNEYGNLIEYSHLPADKTGELTFWIAAHDGKSDPAAVEASNHATRYDVVKTMINVVPGTPFQFAQNFKDKYFQGEKLTLRWAVDQTIFDPRTSRVRIWLSDDLGRTFKHLLVASAPNDGAHDIVIPHILFDRKERYKNEGAVTAETSNYCGVFKIEVIDHIAHAVSYNNPRGGAGFYIREPRNIIFTQTPEATMTVKSKAEIPALKDVVVQASVKSGSIRSISSEEEMGEDYCIRTWTVTDNNGNTSHFRQNILIQKPEVTPLVFTCDLPKDLQIQCVGELPRPQELTVSGGVSPTITLTQTKVKGDVDNFSLYRVWTVTDPVAAPISHTQLIVIHDSVAPQLSQYPKSLIVTSPSAIPQQPVLRAIDNCDGQVDILPSQSYKWDSKNNRQAGIDYRWYARDKTGNQTFYTQYIRIDYDGTLIKRNIGDLKATAQQEELAITRLPNTIVTFNDGKVAYIEDQTHGLRIEKLPETFKAGDRFSDDFVLTGTMQRDKEGRLYLLYDTHTGGVASHAQPLPLIQETLTNLLAYKDMYADRRVAIDAISQNNVPFGIAFSGKPELRIADKNNPTQQLRSIVNQPEALSASKADLTLIGYLSNAETPHFNIMQQSDIWGKITLSDYRYATYYVDAPFVMPTAQTPTGSSTANSLLKGGIASGTPDAGTVSIHYLYPSENVVPAQTALLLHGAAGHYYYQFTKQLGTAPKTNLLHGTLDEERLTKVPGEEQYTYYLLSPDPANVQSGEVGFYRRHADGAPFVMDEDSRTTAYLALPASMSSQAVSLKLTDGGLLTTLPAMNDKSPRVTSIYTLTGIKIKQSVHALPKGTYIINGKKVFIQ